ncbi:hypothetical protein Mapa_001625 [Marchantia paleacea]|nr:hypothetical protein Mapa_001625 [Marchantia paleacea]
MLLGSRFPSQQQHCYHCYHHEQPSWLMPVPPGIFNSSVISTKNYIHDTTSNELRLRQTVRANFRT